VTDKVADASAIAAILFLEPGYEAMEEALSGCELYAPALIQFELANVCLKKIKTRPAERDDLLAAFASFAEMGVRGRDIDFVEAIQLAQAGQLSLYDASYLWLAQSMGAELVTLDKRLGQVAHSASS
jgi:predicted nucleic acid-binding protein